MKPESMPVVEATGRVKFVNRKRLMAHVVKHLIEGRDERWQQLIDEDILAAARVEHREGQPGVAFNTLADQYQAFASEQLAALCAKGQAHQHLCRYTWDLSSRSKKAVSQIIEGWPEREKLLICAAAFVRRDRVGAYKLLTAYRPWPRLSASAHRRKARERLRNRQTVYPCCLLEIHDHGFRVESR